MDDKNHLDQSKRFPPLDKGNLTRRTFLKGLAAIGISAQFSGIFSGSTGKASAIYGEKPERYVTEPSRNIPIYRNVDVLVVGGGMAGISAAIAAGRMGMNTMLIEYMGFLGGNATNSLVTDFCGFYTRTAQTVQLIKGIGGEIVEELIDNGGGRKWRHIVDFDPEALKIVLDKKLLGANVEPLYYTKFAAPIMEGNRVKGVFIENKAGRQAICAKVVLDCTGDGDVCASAGVPFEIGDGNGGMQACDMGFRLVNIDDTKFNQGYFFDNAARMMAEGVASGEYKLTRTGGNLEYSLIQGVYSANMARIPWAVDGTNPEHLTRSSIEGRQIAQEFARFLRDKIPGMENSALVETGVKIGLRETRRVIGEYLLTGEEVLSGRKFTDGVGANAWPLEMHVPGQLERKMSYLKGDDYHTIPYRCLVPKKVDNLLMAGRFISCTHEAQASIRVSGPASSMGQAIGVAAALAVRSNVLPRDINVTSLQNELQRQNVFIG